MRVKDFCCAVYAIHQHLSFVVVLSYKNFCWLMYARHNDQGFVLLRQQGRHNAGTTGGNSLHPTQQWMEPNDDDKSFKYTDAASPVFSIQVVFR